MGAAALTLATPNAAHELAAAVLELAEQVIRPTSGTINGKL